LESATIPKVERVRSLFEVPEKYLSKRQFDIRIRVETVQEFTKGLSFDRVLDIGCGDGSISLPLLPRSRKLTLLDVSSNMLDLANGRIPPDRAVDVDVVNRSFMDTGFPSASFDLILCIGVLAHVDSPAALISEIMRIAKPGGTVILEFTDSFHFWSFPVLLYQQALKLVRPEPYSLNRLSRRQVLRWCESEGFGVSSIFRYSLPLLGTIWVANQEQMYRMTRGMFGDPVNNRNRWMGNEFMYRLKKV